MWPSLGVRSPPWICYICYKYIIYQHKKTNNLFATYPLHVEYRDQFLHLLWAEQLCRAVLVTLVKGQPHIIRICLMVKGSNEKPRLGIFLAYLSGKSIFELIHADRGGAESQRSRLVKLNLREEFFEKAFLKWVTPPPG